MHSVSYLSFHNSGSPSPPLPLGYLWLSGIALNNENMYSYLFINNTAISFELSQTIYDPLLQIRRGNRDNFGINIHIFP